MASELRHNVAMAKKRFDTKQEEAPAAAPQTSGDSTAAAPDRERIAARAYELYLQRGGEPGRAEDDWFTAERELGDRRTPGGES